MNFHVSREGQSAFLYYCTEFKTARKVFATDDYYCFAQKNKNAGVFEEHSKLPILLNV